MSEPKDNKSSSKDYKYTTYTSIEGKKRIEEALRIATPGVWFYSSQELEEMAKSSRDRLKFLNKQTKQEEPLNSKPQAIPYQGAMDPFDFDELDLPDPEPENVHIKPSIGIQMRKPTDFLDARVPPADDARYEWNVQNYKPSRRASISPYPNGVNPHDPKPLIPEDVEKYLNPLGKEIKKEQDYYGGGYIARMDNGEVRFDSVDELKKFAANKQQKQDVTEEKNEDGMISYNGQKYKESECEECYDTGRQKMTPKVLLAKDILSGEKHLKSSMNGYITDINKEDLFVVSYSLSNTIDGCVPNKYVEKFSTSMLNECMFGGNVSFLNKEVLEKAGYVEDVFKCTFYKPEPGRRATPKKFLDYQKFGYPQIFKYKTLDKKEKISFGMESPTFIKTEGKQYTYGVEIETSAGFVPSWSRSDLNINCVYDGSLKDADGVARGGEYVSGILKGDAGLVHLHKIVQELNKRCEINNKCSVHVHIGGVDFTQEFIVYLYLLGLYVEKEIFSMMPQSRAKSEYCQKMTKLDLPILIGSMYDISIREAHDKILKTIALKDIKDYKVAKKFDHPMGHNCGFRRDTPRYWWLNFVPAMFNVRGNESYTAEIRCHSATLNYNKIEKWVLIFMGIINVVESHKDIIKPGVKLSDVMRAAYPKSHKEINEYIDLRKKMFSGKGSEAEASEYADRDEKEKTNYKKIASRK